MSTPTEIAIIALITAEIDNGLGDRLTADERNGLARQIYKAIDGYQTNVTLAALEKAKDTVIAAAAAAANNKQSTEGK